MPRLPATLKVGYKSYEIIPWPLAKVLDDGSVGRHDPNASTIAVASEGRSTADVAETLIHEILHACFHVGHVYDDDDEERTVSITASMLAQIFAENPDLRRYIVEAYAKPGAGLPPATQKAPVDLRDLVQELLTCKDR
jgi:hypothetical protein